MQTFTIGKRSRVSKQDISSLALDRPKRASVGKSRAKVQMTPPLSDEEDAESDFKLDNDVGEEDDYAVDSDAEEAQLAKALQASKRSSDAGSSRASKCRKAAAKPKNNREALRAAVARAAEREFESSGG